MRNRLAGSAAVALGMVGALAASPSFAATGSPTKPTPVPVVHYLHEAAPTSTANATRLRTLDAAPTPPRTADCLATIGVPCYGPTQLAHAYGADAAQQHGMNGAGATIALVESYGSPTIQADLNIFDQAYGLPGTKVETVPFGTLPAQVTTIDQRGWAEETSLDVEYAHAMAPGAHLIVLAVGADETYGSVGMDQMSAAMSWLVTHRHVDTLSLSWGAMEANFAEQTGSTAAGNQLIYSLRGGLQTAAAHHVSILVASGDTGPTGPTLDGTTVYPFRTVSWPASDPLATAVGGTQLHLDYSGARVGPDTAWSLDRLGLAGGAGLSTAFARPTYQDDVTSLVGTQRGMADFSADASCESPLVIDSYYRPNPALHGWARVCGTSAAAPVMAGLVADAAALVRHPLGDVGSALYGLSAHQWARGIADVTAGCTDDFGVTGFCAGTGYDLATGWGTVGNAQGLIRTLAYSGDRE